MHCFIVCLLLLVTKHVKSDESSRNCTEGKVVEVQKGESFTLTSEVEAFAGCYFVFTDDSSRDQCCFQEKGSDQNCEKPDENKQNYKTKCPDFSLTVDDSKSFSCKLTINNVNEAAAGQYKSYDADHKPLQSCLVTVSDEKADGEQKAKPNIGFMLALLGVSHIAWFTY